MSVKLNTNYMSESSGSVRFCNWKWYRIILFLGTKNKFEDLGKGSKTGGENENCHGNFEETKSELQNNLWQGGKDLKMMTVVASWSS